MKILFQKDYDDLKRQITDAEKSANEARLAAKKKNKENLELEEQVEDLTKELTLEKEEKLKLLEEKNRISSSKDKEILELKEQNKKLTGSNGGQKKQINNLEKELEEKGTIIKDQAKELEEAKKKIEHQAKLIDNYKSELEKKTEKKTVIEYEKRIRKNKNEQRNKNITA